MGWTWSHGMGEMREEKRSLENGCFGGSLRSERHRVGETRKMGRFNGTFVSWIGRTRTRERRSHGSA